MTLGIAYYLAAAGLPESLDMARLTIRNGLGRLAAEAGDALQAVSTALADELPAAYAQARNVIELAAARERAACNSAARYTASPEAIGTIARITDPVSVLERALRVEAERAYADRCRALGLKAAAPVLTEEEKALAKIVPVRKPGFVGPVESDFLSEKLGPQAGTRVRLGGNEAYETANYIDGRRTVADIVRAVSATYGPQKGADILEYLKVLAEAGLIEFRS